MSELKLLNPQPMETLPESGEVYCEWENPISGAIYVGKYDVFGVRFRLGSTKHGTYHRWSNKATDGTATFEKGEG